MYVFQNIPIEGTEPHSYGHLVPTNFYRGFLVMAFHSGHPVSVIIRNELPLKFKDPGTPTVSYIIGDKKINNALLDLGSSVNLIPYTVYQQLGLGELKNTRMTLQLTDQSINQIS